MVDIRLCECGCGRYLSKNKKRYFSQGCPQRGKFKVKRETRMCKCGCGETFICRPKVKKQFMKGHQSRGEHNTMFGRVGIFNIASRPEVRKKIAESKIGDKNPMKNKDVANKMAKTQREKGNYANGGSLGKLWREGRMIPRGVLSKKEREIASKRMKEKNPMFDSDIAQKVSKATVKNYIEGKMKFKGGHYFSAKNMKELYYRSSYELQAFTILEQLSKVVKYEVEPFGIEYEKDNKKHFYIPDILVHYDDGTKELIEVKPEWKLGSDDIKIKAGRRYAIQHNMEFSVWTERNLFNSEICKN